MPSVNRPRLKLFVNALIPLFVDGKSRLLGIGNGEWLEIAGVLTAEITFLTGHDKTGTE